MYNKKPLREAINNLDRTKAPAKKKDMIIDPMGQWKYPGQNTRIPGNDITMRDVPYPVWAVPNVGTPQMMYPNQDYYFPGADHVDEYPQMQNGGVTKAQTGKVIKCPEGYTYDQKTKKCVSDYEKVEYGYPEGTDIRDIHAVHDIWPTEYGREFTHINQPIYIKPIQQKNLVYGAGDYQTINIYPDINYKLAVDPSKTEGYDKATNTYYVPSEYTHQYRKYKEWEKAKELEKQNLAAAQELVNTGKFKLEDINDGLNKKVQENYANPAYLPEGLLPYDQFYKSGPKQRYESYLKTNCPECSFGHGESVYYDKDFVYRKNNPSLGGYESADKSIKPIAKRIRENVEPSLVNIEKPAINYRYGVWSETGATPQGGGTSPSTDLPEGTWKDSQENYKKQNRQLNTLDIGSRTFAYGGDISIPDLNQYEDGGEYDLTQDEIDDLIAQGYDIEDVTDQYQVGGAPYNTSGPVSEQDKIQEYTPALKPKAYGHEPEDYSRFQNFAQTLPGNLQDPEYQYGNPDQYDLYGMWRTVGKPGSFKDVQDTEMFPLQEDNYYHGMSVGDDGTLLKPMSHHTTWMEVMNSQLNTDPYFRENRLIKNEQGRLQYVPNKQTGGQKEQYYTYGQSKNKYKKIGNQWYISNQGTSFNFIPIKDPTGSRTKELNKNAKLDPNAWVRPTNTIEGKLNAFMGDPQGQSARASEWYTRKGEDESDNIRHTAAGYTTQKAIKNATGSDLLGYVGSIGLGVGHELGTMFTDPRSWNVVLQEAAEDIQNNNLGARMGYQNAKDPFNKINYLSKTYQIPDGYGAINPFPGSTWTDPYNKTQRAKVINESKGKTVPVGLTDKLQKGGFQDDLGKHQKLLRDWTYGASIGTLHKAQEGESVVQSVTPWAAAPEVSGEPTMPGAIYEAKPITVKGQAPEWAKFQKEYQNTKPWEKFLYDEQQKYLRRTKGLNKAAGVSMENFPQAERIRIKQRYDEKMNNYITKRLGQHFGFNPHRRGDWLDLLTDKEREIVAGSKFGSKLQPSAWSNFLSGLRSASSMVMPGGRKVFGKIPIPGYTEQENKEAIQSWLEPANVFSILDLPGIAIANAAENMNREQPSILAAEPMANVDPYDVLAVNPMTYIDLYTLPETVLHLGKGLVKGARAAGKGVKSGYNAVATGNSLLTDLGVQPWKLEKPVNKSLYSGLNRPYIAGTVTDRQAELLSKFGKGMQLNPQEWEELSALTKSGATDFSKGDIPISRVIGYYAPGSAENKAIQGLKIGDVFTTPAEKSIRTWSAGIPDVSNAEYLKGKTRLVVPSRYTKGLGAHFAGMPYEDLRVKFIHEDPVTGMRPYYNFNAARENELIGNIPEGFKVIGKSSEEGMNNLIIKPIKKRFSSQGFTKSGFGGLDMSMYEIKNPDYFTQLLNTYDNKTLSSKNKKFYKDLIESVKKQNGLATERQYNELQRLKSGNFNFGKKGYQEGGFTEELNYEEADLTPEEIDWYLANGYDIEDMGEA